MFETHVYICDHRGLYPKQTVLCNDIGYSYFKNIPFYLKIVEFDNLDISRPISSRNLFDAAFLITRRDYPAYSLFPNSSGLIILKSKTQPDLAKVLARIKGILSGRRTIPILYDPRISTSNAKEIRTKINLIRSETEYIDLFHSKRIPFRRQVDEWSKSFVFAKHKPSPLAVKRYFNMFQRSSRFIHIALHYFVNASRLIHNYFFEDGGLNLYLTVEALIRDFMEFHSIRNKRTAAIKFQATVLLPYYHMEFLYDLYEARNLYLAHIDENMFTEQQNIGYLENYCLEHYESVSWLITRHIRYKQRTGVAD